MQCGVQILYHSGMQSNVARLGDHKVEIESDAEMGLRYEGKHKLRLIIGTVCYSFFKTLSFIRIEIQYKSLPAYSDFRQ